MPYYIVAEHCGGCEQAICFTCTREDRSLKLKRVFSEEEPSHALYGPCDRLADLLSDRLWRLFQFNEETQELFFKVNP